MLPRNLAQRIGGESRGDFLKGRHWRLFAHECSLNSKQVLDRVRVTLVPQPQLPES